jgi:hypothetical protein
LILRRFERCVEGMEEWDEVWDVECGRYGVMIYHANRKVKNVSGSMREGSAEPLTVQFTKI